MRPLLLAVTLAALFAMASIAAPIAQHHSPEPGPDWFAFQPKNAFEPGSIGLADWLHTPAGKHGYLRMDGDRLVFEDGAPVKFWGTNHGNRGVAPEREEADRRAAWYARYGINAIRLHKFTWPGPRRGIGDPQFSTQFEEEALDRMDYYMNQLRQRGIYYVWSHIFGHNPAPGDRDRLLAYDEIVRNDSDSFLANSTYGVVNLFQDLQDLNIELTVNLLQHRNPHTGLTYAEDPALAYIELQNEDNAWWTAGDHLQKMPTYKARLCRLFSDWLREKYGSEEALIEAWGEQGLDLWPELQSDESLAKSNIYPHPDRRYYQPDDFANSPSPQRLADCARFLHERQQAFYDRFSAAIRATGYRGVIAGSCWKADSGVPHYYNLYSDYLTGLIDRHNYYAGNGHRLADGMSTGQMNSALSQDNLGLLGVGMNQVSGRPFALSEWIEKLPNLFIAEGCPIIAAYGMGLQGWDASFHFASSQYGISEAVEAPNVYNTNNPTQISLFPALARMIYRGDIREAPPLSKRKVSVAELREGRIGFSESAQTQGDVNTLSGFVPPESLAVGKTLAEFTSEPLPTEPVDLSPYRDGDWLRSATGQLAWNRSGQGYFTLDTPATKGVVGHAGGEDHRLGEVTLSFDNPFAVVLLTSLDKTGTLDNARRALLTVVSQARNTGMRYSEDFTVLEEVGGPPVLMESIRGELHYSRLPGAMVYPLDHDGVRSSRPIPLADARFAFDTAIDKTVYYEIVWPE